MQIIIDIDTGSAAFDDLNAGTEVARILRKLAGQVENWSGLNGCELGVLDANGNRVGMLRASEQL